MSKTINHTEYPLSLKSKTDAELRGIIIQCNNVLTAWKDHPNAGYYLDEISYCAMELKIRTTSQLPYSRYVPDLPARKGR